MNKNSSGDPKKNTTSKAKDALGKGIRSLLQNIESDLTHTEKNLLDTKEKITTPASRVPLHLIEPNPDQPRHDFDENALSELAASVKLHDIIQPITVTKMESGRYRIIAGERRFRAAKIAGLVDIPVYVRETKNSKLLELALLENLQREDLNAIEIALSYRQLMEELDYGPEQLAERMGKERSTVTNYVRLLKLPPDIQAAVRNDLISMGHARALINVDLVDKDLDRYPLVYMMHEPYQMKPIQAFGPYLIGLRTDLQMDKNNCVEMVKLMTSHYEQLHLKKDNALSQTANYHTQSLVFFHIPQQY